MPAGRRAREWQLETPKRCDGAKKISSTGLLRRWRGWCFSTCLTRKAHEQWLQASVGARLNAKSTEASFGTRKTVIGDRTYYLTVRRKVLWRPV